MTADDPSDHAGQANTARHVIGPRGEVQNVTANREGPGGTGTRGCCEGPRPGAAGPEMEALDRFYRDVAWRGVIHPGVMDPGTPAMTAVRRGTTRAIADGRSQVGRGGPLQFPPPLSERSAPLTPGNSSRLHLQDLHRFHGLRPSPPGSASPRPRHPARSVDDAAGFASRYGPLSCTPPNRSALRWAPAPPVSRRNRQPTGLPDDYPDRTSTGKRRRAYGPVINHSFAQTTNHYWTDRRLTHGGIPLGG